MAMRGLGASVQEESLVLSKQQVKKRCFEIQALVLPEDICALVESMNLKSRVRIGSAIRRAMDPFYIERVAHV